MNWWILSGALIVASIAIIYIGARYWWDDTVSVLLGSILMAIGLVTLLIAIFGMVGAPQSINYYIKQKEYIETHVAIDPIENAALTNKKIELNSWLYGAQYSNANWGGWSFYPDSVQQLKPIQ